MARVRRVVLGNILLLLKHERNNCPAARYYVWSDGWGHGSHFAVMKTTTQRTKPTCERYRMEMWQEPGSR